MSTTIENLQGKVFDSICEYQNCNIYDEVKIEEFVRNEAEGSPTFFSYLFDLEEEILFCELTEEQREAYEEFVAEVVATYNEEYAEDEE